MTDQITSASASTDTPPDHLANNPKSPHFNAAVVERGVGVRFNGLERNNVDEYCISEGWIRVPSGKTVDRHGQPMTLKLKGTVQAYFRDVAST
jgi:Protein of unknown function (DUF3297)